MVQPGLFERLKTELKIRNDSPRAHKAWLGAVRGGIQTPTPLVPRSPSGRLDRQRVFWNRGKGGGGLCAGDAPATPGSGLQHLLRVDITTFEALRKASQGRPLGEAVTHKVIHTTMGYGVPPLRVL